MILHDSDLAAGYCAGMTDEFGLNRAAGVAGAQPWLKVCIIKHAKYGFVSCRSLMLHVYIRMFDPCLRWTSFVHLRLISLGDLKDGESQSCFQYVPTHQ